MKIRITVYKTSGKYYTHEDVEQEEDILLFKEEFKQFIRDNIPANLGSGFIVVDDVDEIENQSFHNVLYRYDEVFNNNFYFG